MCEETNVKYIAPSVSNESLSDQHRTVDAKVTEKATHQLVCQHTPKQMAATTQPGSLERASSPPSRPEVEDGCVRESGTQPIRDLLRCCHGPVIPPLAVRGVARVEEEEVVWVGVWG